MKKGLFCALVAFALASGSCSRNGLYPVAGKVTHKGDPAAGAVVYFHRRDNACFNPSTYIGFRTSSVRIGLPEGRTDVSISEV